METEVHLTQGEVTKLFEQMVLAISDMVAVRDQYTAEHHKHIAELSVAIAKEVGMSESRIHGLRLAAMIHDLGNMAVPADILNKSAKLSALEFEIVKTHSQVGYNILKIIDFPWPIAEIVLQHHECMDGSGYPQGLKGDDVLLESRVLIVANVIESMTSYRPGRAPHSLNETIAEIIKYRGTKFDATVVDACIKVVASKADEY